MDAKKQIKSQKKIAYEKPVLVSLVTETAQGLCNTGSGDSKDCSTGLNPGRRCKTGSGVA